MVTTAIKTRFNKDLFEAEAWAKNELVCGIDEVGRGCLAGPVVTAAVILMRNKKSRLVKDSKLMTQDELYEAYQWIIKNSWYSVGIIHNRGIDKHNIYQATLMAMKRSLIQLLFTCKQKPSKILIDAMPLKIDLEPYNNLEIIHFTKGERRSSSIAAASIVAKVTRDQIMHVLDPVFPGYYLKEHKGYSTPKHKQAVRELGHSIIHRMSFLNNTLFTQEVENEGMEQQSLFEANQQTANTESL